MTVEKVKVMVLCKDRNQMEHYSKLFKFLMMGRVEKLISRRDSISIEGKDFRIEFIILTGASRGCKAHYVINLVQDKELHECVAMSMTSIHTYLTRDPNWVDIFGG